MSRDGSRSLPPAPVTEFGLIASVRKACMDRGPLSDRVVLGIGDDCAALQFEPGRPTLVTTDMLMDGRHFRSEVHAFDAIGEKAMGVNLSDIAAMAGIPVAAVVAVALPVSLGSSRITTAMSELHRGLMRQADRFGVALVGGDTNAWEGPLVLAVTLMGQAGPRGLVRRGGAIPGDAILVTGPLGGSLLGRHMTPRPRVREALALHEVVPIHAMIDISDGLAADLGHILDESGGLGAWLDARSIPVSDDAKVLASKDGRTPLDHALADGEDFELCLTLSPNDARRALDSPPSGVSLHQIGTVVEHPGLALRFPDGRIEPIRAAGFDHLAGAGPPEGRAP
jgi:thiamine-monophosphate kinase